MPVIRKAFGRLEDGRPADSIVLSDARGALLVEVLDYGATIRAIKVAGPNGRLVDTVLSYPSLVDYERGKAYLGATIGRCAGRTDARAHATLQLSRNEQSNHLHGGTTGFSHSLWSVADMDGGAVPKVRLRHRSPAGEDGYPGEVIVDAEFSLVEGRALRVVMEARSDADTPLNLTLHPYFNLNGNAVHTVENHRLRIASDRILAVGATRLPTGELMAVERTPFDFRSPRSVGASLDDRHPQLRLSGGYDHYYVLDKREPVGADIYSPTSSVGLRVSTNQRGLQFYSGNQLNDATPLAFPARGGFCLEPHAFPNAINEPSFPDITLRTGELYRSETSYEFYTYPPGG